MSTLPQALYCSGSSLISSPESLDDLQSDPRGIAWLWESPMPQAKYIMGMDPTVGITNWSRASRTDNDHKTDNGAIEVWRVDAIRRQVIGRDGKPEIDPATRQPRIIMADLQVAEYAAPIDAVEIARVAKLLGTIYCGDSDLEQCELIFESYPGPGILTLQELLRIGYGNLWCWEYIDNIAEATNRIGWRSWQTSQRLLWQRARRHIISDCAEVRSPWLLEELANATFDPVKLRAIAAYGSHDDRLYAASMAWWAGHHWTYDEPIPAPVTTAPVVDYQRLAPVLGEHRSIRDAWADAVEGWD